MRQFLISTARRARLNPLAMGIWGLLKLIPPIRRLANRIRESDDSLRVRDLDTITSQSLPSNARFQSAARSIDKIDGMFPLFSVAVMDTMLSLQVARGISGHFLEMGVFRGKSAVLMADYLRAGDRMVLVDIVDNLDRNALSAHLHTVDFVLGDTGTFSEIYPGYHKLRHRCRFIHIDASHAYVATYNEMKIADEMLASDGIIAVDDFSNLNYSQNAAAVYKYLYRSDTDLMILLVTNQKVYLCRRSAFPLYGGLILDCFLPEMASRGMEATIARTDVEKEYRAFYVRDRDVGETGFYGPEIYRDKLIRP